ncbi:MotA/TolQ/ExbB proton channel family protein [Verrucomicrobiota bacterium]
MAIIRRRTEHTRQACPAGFRLFALAGLAAAVLTTAGCGYAGPGYTGAQSAYDLAMVRDIIARGGPVMWPLLACSLIALAVTVERILFWWRECRTNRSTPLIEELFLRTEQGEFDQAASLAQGRSDAFVRVLVSGLRHRDYGMTESMTVAANDEIAHMKQAVLPRPWAWQRISVTMTI